jgi:hypothetical protein
VQLLRLYTAVRWEQGDLTWNWQLSILRILFLTVRLTSMSQRKRPDYGLRAVAA